MGHGDVTIAGQPANGEEKMEIEFRWNLVRRTVLGAIALLTLGISAHAGPAFVDNFDGCAQGPLNQSTRWDTGSYNAEELLVVADPEDSRNAVLQCAIRYPCEQGEFGAIAKAALPDDRIVEFDARVKRQVANIIVNFRIAQLNDPKKNNLPNRFRIWSDWKGHIFYQPACVSTDLIVAWRPISVRLSEEPTSVNDGAWHHWRIIAAGKEIAVELDNGMQVLRTRCDDAAGGPYSVGFASRFGEALYDNIRIAALSGGAKPPAATPVHKPEEEKTLGVDFSPRWHAGMKHFSVRDFGASGSNVATTGAIKAGTDALILANALDFKNGQGIYVGGAGYTGSPLVARIIEGGGTRKLRLSRSASTTVEDTHVTHDDTRALQEAMLSASAGLTGRGAIVEVPGGEYLISDTIYLMDAGNVIIKGAGGGIYAAGTMLVWNGPPGGRMLHFIGVSGCTVEGIVLQGNKKAGSGLWFDSTWDYMQSVQNRLFNVNITGVSYDEESTGLELGHGDESEGQVSEHVYEDVYIRWCGRAVAIRNTQSCNFKFRDCAFPYNPVGVYITSNGVLNLMFSGTNYSGNKIANIYYEKASPSPYTAHVEEYNTFSHGIPGAHIKSRSGGRFQISGGAISAHGGLADFCGGSGHLVLIDCTVTHPGIVNMEGGSVALIGTFCPPHLAHSLGLSSDRVKVLIFNPEMWGGGDGRFLVGAGTGDPALTVNLARNAVRFGGSISRAVRQVSEDTALGEQDDTIVVDASAGDVRVTLPSAEKRMGRTYTVKKVDSSAHKVIVQSQENAKIDGESQYVLQRPWQYVTVISGGSAWVVVGAN